MSEPNERDRAHADVQALMREEAARRELHECRATLELERTESMTLLKGLAAANLRADRAEEEVDEWKQMEGERTEELQAACVDLDNLRAEVERLKQELADMTHKYRNQCDATDGQTEQLAYAEGHLQEAQAEVERLKAELSEERAVCLCGCPAADHEDYPEEGQDCGVPGHECILVAKAVLESVTQERERLRSLPDRMWDAYRETNFARLNRYLGEVTYPLDGLMRWARRWLRREVRR
jgi:DNA repair exonuclease SbcCD ATPase subunit